MGYRLNHLDEPVFMAVSKLLLAELGIHHRLESCDTYISHGLGSFVTTSTETQLSNR